MLMGGRSKTIDIFKELNPDERSMSFADKGKKTAETKTNKHLTPSYKNYIAK